MEIRIPVDAIEQKKALVSFVQTAFSHSVEQLHQTIAASADKGIEITIKPLVLGRTRQQEKYYRKWCGAFGSYCGTTPDETHNEILKMAFGSEQVATKFGYIWRPVKRSGRLNRLDYSLLVDTLIRVAAEMGFQVPPPIKSAKKLQGNNDE